MMSSEKNRNSIKYRYMTLANAINATMMLTWTMSTVLYTCCRNFNFKIYVIKISKLKLCLDVMHLTAKVILL